MICDSPDKLFGRTNRLGNIQPIPGGWAVESSQGSRGLSEIPGLSVRRARSVR